MDYQKNTQGHGLVSQRNQTGIEAFSITLSKKCERLATAIYLVTNFLSDTEPMKSRLRTLSLDFVRDASFVRYGAQATEASVLDTLRANIGETLSLLELAFIAGLVSEMNFTILKREYASLRDSIDIKKVSRESRTDTVLGDNFFESYPRSELESADSCLRHEISRGRSSVSRPHLTPALSQRSDLARTREGRTFVPASVSAPASYPASKSPSPMSDRNPKGQQSPRPDLGYSQGQALVGTASERLSKTPQGHVSAPVTLPTNDYQLSASATRDSRRTRILKLVKDNREVAIRDIVAHFPDVSEKTIQRELVSLSDSGVLKKSGERRWSRYALA